MMKNFKHGRTKPYTDRGIARLPCFRCGRRPSKFQWQICADGNLYHPLCEACDIAINEMVLRWMRFPRWRALLTFYKRTIG